MPKVVSLPKYCLHKSRGLAYMRVNGKFIYLGEYGSPESKEAYGRHLAEMAVTPAVIPSQTTSDGILVKELIDTYWLYAESYYQKREAASPS